MSEQNKKIIAGLHRKDLTNIKFASALLDMAIEEKKDDLHCSRQRKYSRLRQRRVERRIALSSQSCIGKLL